MSEDSQEERSLFDVTEFGNATHPNGARQTKRRGDFFENKQPQSKEKHDILAFYLKPWIKVISKHFKKVVYVDGFAGPGVCETGEACSPVLAASILAQHSVGQTQIHLYAIETQRERFSSLVDSLRPYNKSLNIEAIRDPFRKALPKIIGSISKMHERTASFFFIDPHGYKAVRFEDIESILQLSHSEVLVHFPYNGIVRGLGVPAVHSTIDQYYGQANVAARLHKAAPAEKKDLMVTTFEQGFRELGCYTRSFEISMPHADRPYFYMVYMTREPLGYIIMNDIWIKREKKRTNVRQGELIKLFDLDEQAASQDTLQNFLKSTFTGQTVIRKVAIAFALTHHRSTKTDVNKALESLHRQRQAAIRRANGMNNYYDEFTFR